ncbi:MAG: Ku protein [Deltaproteobacteria bacterium HGW-Deltaproteobacteria-6]|jgi:DNA end-binding protein Ku|nr:MAG: Ku protein [Deltaproteobacteria bacterium HGW-Deltaproteobacteria-6]
MTGRAIWKGNIHLGLIDIPVKLHTAVKEEHIQFHLLHKKDHIKLKQQMICAHEKVPVPPEEQIRGFKLDDGRYILVTPSELAETLPEDSRVITVLEFVKASQIDPLFISRGYYLEPENRDKAYLTLAAALADLDVEGICTWTMRKRSYIGALQVSGRLLRLNTLRYADEVIPASSLDLPHTSISEKELQIASDLIGHLTASFEPRKFENEHEKKLRQLIDKKARGEKIVILRPQRRKPTSPDKLLQALEASLKKVA